jgi:outer membrane receptor protein involved in Fe transport
VTYTTDEADSPLPFGIPGSIALDGNVEHQITNTQNTLGSLNYFAGTYLGTSGYIQPKWKATLFADYHVSDWTFHYDSQFVGGTTDAGGGTGYGFTMPDLIYHNISVSYNLPEWGPSKGSMISFGINNLFDKDPPLNIEDGVGKNNTISGPYDEVGRFFYTRITVKF